MAIANSKQCNMQTQLHLVHWLVNYSLRTFANCVNIQQISQHDCDKKIIYKKLEHEYFDRCSWLDVSNHANAVCEYLLYIHNNI